MKQFVFFFNKNYLDETRLTMLYEFILTLFYCEYDIVWKEAVLSFRYLVESSEKHKFIKSLIKKLIKEANQREIEK